jgi:proton glutamate symport protein
LNLKHRLLYTLIFSLGTLAIFLGLANFYGWIVIPVALLTASRWIVLALMVVLAIRRKSLTTWVVVSMFLGGEIGFSFPAAALYLDPLSGIFLRLIKTIIGPLLFSTLVVGIAAHPDLRQVGRMGLKAILYFEIVTSLALVIGLAAINLTKAGEGAAVEAQPSSVERAHKLLEHKEPHNVVVDIFPENIVKSISEDKVLQIVVFSILFGIALAMLNEEKKKPMLRFAEGLSDVMFKFTDLVMYFAPFAVGGALAYSIASMGFGIVKHLLLLVLTLYAAIVVFILVVLVPVGFIIKLNFNRFVKAISEPAVIAFSTATSEAALPKAMENLEQMGIPRKVVAFVLPTGYSLNLDGSTLYLSLATVFVAQLAGLDLTLGEQIKIVLILMLTSKGVAGVRGGTFLILVTTLDSLHIDPQKAFVLLGVDALMDMGRTAVNVIGNCLATVVVAKWEGEYSDG